MEDILFESLAEVSRRLHARELSPVELTDAVLARIEARASGLGVFVTVVPERARAAAREAESALASGRSRGPLHGVPVSVKDLFHMRGLPTTAASPFPVQEAAAADAAVVERLEAAGAVIVGKTNLHEFAFGTTCTSSAFGAVRNPWDPERIAGGSSGGSAAAVAAGMSYASIGTDTGGSVRIPAACCGIVGLKPGFGRVSRHGLVPLSPRMDHVGPLARTAEDAALVLAALAGHDPRDAASLPGSAWAAEAAATGSPGGLVLGVLEGAFAELPAPVATVLDRARQELQGAGARLASVELEGLEAVRRAAFVVVFAESLATHAERFEAQPEIYFPDVRARLARARELSALDLVRALAERRAARARAEALFSRIDALLLPMLPMAAPPLESERVQVGERELEVPAALTTWSREWNLLGLPALSLPCGFDAQGLPLAFQLVGPPGGEATLLGIASAYQAATDWHLRRPPS